MRVKCSVWKIYHKGLRKLEAMFKVQNSVTEFILLSIFQSRNPKINPYESFYKIETASIEKNRNENKCSSL